MKKSKEDELVAIQYKIEKSDMNQQKLENRLISISKELLSIINLRLRIFYI